MIHPLIEHARARTWLLVILTVIGMQLVMPVLPLAHADHPSDHFARCDTCAELTLCQAAPLVAPVPALLALVPTRVAPHLAHPPHVRAPHAVRTPARAPPSVLS